MAFNKKFYNKSFFNKRSMESSLTPTFHSRLKREEALGFERQKGEVFIGAITNHLR